MAALRYVHVVAGVTLLLAACSDTDAPADRSPSPAAPSSATTAAPSASSPGSAAPTAPSGPVAPAGVEEIVTGLDAPWSIAFLPDGSALVSQRDDATIVHVTDSGDVTTVGEVAGVDGDAEGGLLGIAFDPASPDTLYAYASFGSQNRVVRTTYAEGAFGEFEVILDGIPAASRHNGGRLVFGPDGMLYVSTGDAGNTDHAQDRDSLGGKILRITPDGDVPSDNPFDGSPVYSYGHRNVQGLAFDDDGQLWATEFGSDERDELNRIEPGANYGWPHVEGIAGDSRFTDPVVEWPTPDASPSALAYVADTLFLAALRGERLWRVPIPGGTAGEPSVALDGYGRLRDAVRAPDGTLWVLTNNTDGRAEPQPGDDRILRLTLEPAP